MMAAKYYGFRLRSVLSAEGHFGRHSPKVARAKRA